MDLKIPKDIKKGKCFFFNLGHGLIKGCLVSGIIAPPTYKKHILDLTWVKSPSSTHLTKIDLRTSIEMAAKSLEGFTKKVAQMMMDQKKMLEQMGALLSIPYFV